MAILSFLVELLLEPFSDVEMLPLDADPALDAEDAKLSAWAGAARAAVVASRPRARVVFVMVFSCW